MRQVSRADKQVRLWGGEGRVMTVMWPVRTNRNACGVERGGLWDRPAVRTNRNTCGVERGGLWDRPTVRTNRNTCGVKRGGLWDRPTVRTNRYA